MNFLYFLSELRNPVFDALFQLVTYFGEQIPILLIICAFYWCLNKPLAYRIGLSFFASGIAVQNLKITFRIPRPWVLDPAFRPVESAIPAATGFSFPSGHSQSAASFWGTIGISIRKRGISILCAVLFLLVGFSRMYLGVHTPKDVLFGLAIGFFFAAVIAYLFDKLKNTKKENLIVALFLGIFSVFTAMYAYLLLKEGLIPEHNAEDCFKTAGAGLGFALGWYVERVHIRFSTDLTTKGKLVRYLLGVVILLLLYLLLGAILGDALPLQMLKYFLVVFYIIAVYPACFSRWNRHR